MPSSKVLLILVLALLAFVAQAGMFDQAKEDCGTCGTSYQACCVGYAVDGYPCNCHLEKPNTDGHSCGDCGVAYELCCAGFEKEGDPCTCTIG